MGLDEAAERYGADVAYPLSELEEKLPGLLKGSDRVLFRIGSDSRCQALAFAALERARNRGTRRAGGPGPRRNEDWHIGTGTARLQPESNADVRAEARPR